VWQSLCSLLVFGCRVSFLTVEDLTVRYEAGQSARRVLDRVSFVIGSHEIVGVSGPSGSGKTTAALALLGLLPADAIASGSIRLEGRDLTTLSERERAAVRGAQIGIVFQESALALNPVLTVGAQIAEVVRAHSCCNRKDARDRALAAMCDVGLHEHTQRIHDAYPHELSGGQRQRILIAQAIVCRPKLVVADEPTASLDAGVRDEILRLIRRLNEREGIAFVLITHSADVLETTAHRVIAMEGGHVVSASRLPREPLAPARMTTPQVRAFPSARSSAVVEVTGATRSYHQRRFFSRANHTVTALKSVNLRIEPGSTIGLAGQSGCGKSTLARTLAALEPLDAGALRIDGHDITGLRGGALQLYRNQVQLIFQDSAAALNPRFTALDIISEPLTIQSATNPTERRLRAMALMADVGLPADRLQARAGEFSGGERQRLAIARALAVRPRLLILDEAFSGLDVDTRTRITQLLLDLQRQHDLALLCISHDLTLLDEFASEVVVMHDGEIVERRMSSFNRFIPPAEAVA
jgi:peptide/nickel transport system ATP-binding protein